MNESYWHRAQRSIAQGALTNSKHPDSLINGLFPTHVKKGYGCYLTDEKGQKWLDFMGGLGTGLFGTGNPRITMEAIRAINDGSCHSLPTVYEVETAEKLKQMFHWVDRWKFLKTGSEACSASIRIARNATGRYKVLSEAYHGWHDEFCSLTPPAHGVPDHPFIGKLTDLSQIKNDVAAVIVEPVVTDISTNRREWLKELRQKCSDNGVMLIFDEVITGFRFPKFSVSAYWNIEPDLIILGKAIGGGFPLAAVGGRPWVMDDRKYFVSSTYAGETASLAACQAVINLLLKDPSYNIENLWDEGQKFMDEFNSLGPIQLEGYPTRGIITGDHGLFMQEAAKAKMLFCKSWFYNWDLAKEKYGFMPQIKEIQERIGEGLAKMEYPAPSSPFSMKVREK